MKYYVYKTTCLVNKKFYIGVHKSKDIQNDPYLGSGLLVSKSIAKYGKNNFQREILGEFETKEEAFSIEKAIVTEELLKNQKCLNLSIGGQGGDGPNAFISDELRKATGKKSALKLSGRTKETHEYIARTSLKRSEALKGRTKNNHAGRALQAEKISGDNNPMKREEIRLKFVGENNSKSVISNQNRINLVKDYLSDKYTRKELSEIYRVSLSLTYKLTSNPQKILEKYGDKNVTNCTH